MIVSLRGALAYALISQVWLMVYVVSLRRVQQPTNIQVRRLNVATRKLQSCPKKIAYPAMTPTDEVDVHSDSGYRCLTGDANDDESTASAGQTCYGVATREVVNLLSIL